jgi:long-chain fatty acid transport protein
MKTSLIAPIVAAIALSAGSACMPAWGSGLSLDESSAGEIGNAHAGTAAADDASTIVWNPAGLAYLPGVHFTGNLTGIDYSPKFTNTGSTSAVGSPATGGDGGNAGGLTLLPSLFFSAQLTPSVTAGVGVFTPFGLKVEYDNGWVGRYQTIKSDLETVNINPTVAWKATEQVSLAGGLDIMNASADLTRNIDFGSICFGSAFGPANCTGAGITPQNKDGAVELKGSSWGVGFNLGAMFQPSDKMRFGLTYRSAIREDVRGSATFVNPALPGPFVALTGTAATTSSNFTSTVWLPESANASFLAKVTPQLTILGNLNWTRWSRLNELRARFDNGAPDNVTTFNWRNTWNVSLGVNYQLMPALKLRTGVEYETNASRYGQRNPLVPESTRRLIAVGVNYQFTPKDSVDFGYSHVFFGDFSISSTATAAGTLNGTYKVSADLFALQYNRSF